jgi:RHS repeat-associated protein
VTDDNGLAVAKHDFYPFGIEMASSFSGMPGESRMRYTVHERDAATGTDYMMARYKVASAAAFLRPDFADDVSMAGPSSWNKYSYVRNNPLSFIDPSGERYKLTDDREPYNISVLYGGTGYGEVAGKLLGWGSPFPVTYAGAGWLIGWGAPGGGLPSAAGNVSPGIMDITIQDWFYQSLQSARTPSTPWFLLLLQGSGPYDQSPLPWGGYASCASAASPMPCSDWLPMGWEQNPLKLFQQSCTCFWIKARGEYTGGTGSYYDPTVYITPMLFPPPPGPRNFFDKNRSFRGNPTPGMVILFGDHLEKACTCKEPSILSDQCPTSAKRANRGW